MMGPALGLFVACAFAAGFDLDPNRSALYALVLKDPETIASGMAHDHVVVAAGWNGKVLLDGGACRVEVVVPVHALVVDDPAWRARLGLPKVPPSHARRVRRSMLAEDQLDAGEHPEIRFKADQCVRKGDSLVIDGHLTVRGVTRGITVPIRLTSDSDRLRVVGRFTIRATDFGFEPYAAFLGAVRNRDEMVVVLDLVGTLDTP